ncbi:transposase [Streptomyces chartreusis]|uniref:IS110 family transposase n=1 Tax=Streptomyces chartreusis TaxID=1969 RepID=UPI0036C89755
MSEYDGHQYVGIDLHRRRSVIVRQTADGTQLSAVRIANDPVALGLQIEQAGSHPDVVVEATYGWYWAIDVLQAAGAEVRLAHPLGVKGFAYRRVKNDIKDASDLADLLRMGRLPESWIAPRDLRELRELVRYRAKLVALRSGLKAQVHAVLAKAGVLIAVSDLFGTDGRRQLGQTTLAGAYAQRVVSLLSTPRKLSSTPGSPSVFAATPAVGPSGVCPASDRSWPPCWSPRSATCTASPPPTGCAPGPD